jgi:hypothetical protein
MPYEFVVKPESILVHQPALGCQHDCIVETAAPNEAQIPERLDLRFRYKGAGRGHLSSELTIRDLYGAALHADQRVRKIYQARDREIICWTNAHSPIAVGYFYMLEHSQKLARGLKFSSSSMLYHFYEWLSASVKDGYFQRVKLDDAVVDVASRQSRKQMLDSRDHYSLPH